MTFTQPLFLWGLLGLLIPIIIHLFYFRRHKKVYFSDVRYLKEIKEERSTIERLKHLAILTTRLLALAFLVFAFAQPVKKEKDIINDTADIAIYIDNSKSMLLESEEGSALIKAKKNALDIINSSDELNRFLIFENGDNFLSSTWLTKEQAIESVKSIEVSNQFKSFTDIDKVAAKFLEKNKRQTTFYWISDCQKNVIGMPGDSTVDHRLWPIIHNNVDNLYLDTMFLLEPVQSNTRVNKLVVRIVNSGNQKQNDIRLSLALDGVAKSNKNMNLEPATDQWDTLQFTVKDDGWKKLNVEIVDNNVKYDNKLYGAFYLESQKNVLEIGNAKSSNAFISSVFKASDYTNHTFQDVLKVKYSAISEYDLIVLNSLTQIPEGLLQSLKDYLALGGNLTIIPGSTSNFGRLSNDLEDLGLDGISNLLKQKTQANQLNLNEKVLKDVLVSIPRNMQYPTVDAYYELNQRNRSTKKTIIATANRKDILVKYTVEAGSVFLYTTPINEFNTGLTQHYIFAPTLFNMAYAAPAESKLYYSLADNINIQLASVNLGGDDVLTVKGDVQEFFPRQTNLQNRTTLSITPDLMTAGYYDILNKDKLVSKFAVNYDRSESKLKFYSLEELAAEFPDFKLMVDERNKVIESFRVLQANSSGWKICLILALLFLAIEAMLIRIFT